MFSAMSSRPLVLLLGLVLALGAGWAIFELRLEERADAPPSATSGPAPERPLGEEGGPERPAAQAPAAPADASAPESDGGPDRETAAVAARPPAAPTSTPEAERLKPRVEGLKAQVERAEHARAAAPAPGELAPTDEPAAGR
jgi:hypothetical protein